MNDHVWPTPLTIFFRSPKLLKLGMNHQGLKVYKVSINDDHGLTLTYFTAMSILVKIAYYANIGSVYRTIQMRLVRLKDDDNI